MVSSLGKARPILYFPLITLGTYGESSRGPNSDVDPLIYHWQESVGKILPGYQLYVSLMWAAVAVAWRPTPFLRLYDGAGRTKDSRDDFIVSR